MTISEQVARLESDNANLRAGWRHDLQVLIALAKQAGKTELADAAKNCRENI